MRIAMVSEHASPLVASNGLGGVDAGGQNVAVRALALALADAGHEVVVHTRRTDPRTPRRVPMAAGVVVDHVDAGPPAELPKDELVDLMDAFSADLAACWRAERPDVVHAHFWMSGLAALPAARALGVPIVQTFHALGSVKRRHQGADDTSPARRVAAESDLGASVDRVLATCRDEADELAALGVPAEQVTVVPCGVDVEHFTPGDGVSTSGRGGFRVLTVSRLVPRKGVDTVIAALGRLPRDVELTVAGGPSADRLDDDPEVRRLRALAARTGVADRVTFLGAVAHDALPGALPRRRRRGLRPGLRAVRARPARGDGLRAPRRRGRGRRARRHRRRRRHRPPRPGGRPGRGRRGARRAAGASPPRPCVRAGRATPRGRRVRLGPRRRRPRAGVRGRPGVDHGCRPAC